MEIWVIFDSTPDCATAAAESPPPTIENEFDSAIDSLNTARSLADESWRDDVSWYLALALDRAGRSDDARREVETLCGRAGEYQQKACAAVEELRR